MFELEELQALLNQNIVQAEKELAGTCGTISQKVISDRLHKMIKIQKEGK